jgi:hypothetical protein
MTKFTAYLHWFNADGEFECHVPAGRGRGPYFDSVKEATDAGVAFGREENAPFARDGVPFTKCFVRIFDDRRMVKRFDACKTKGWRVAA